MDVEDDNPAAATITVTGNSTEITEEAQGAEPWRRENLALQIPSGTMESPPPDVIINVPSSSTHTVNASLVCSPCDYNTRVSPGRSSTTKSPFRHFISEYGIKSRSNNVDVEKAAIQALGDRKISRTSSLTNVFTPKMKRTLSLPVIPIAHSNPESLHGGADVDSLDYEKFVRHATIHRSRSAPVILKDGSNKPTDSGRGVVIRVMDATPRTDMIVATSDEPSSHAVGHDGEDIPEGEAVCRICMIELGEGVETFKMECCCRGELALAHKECLVKWFNMKGNKICEVCKEEVQNLPVTLLRIQSTQSITVHELRAESSTYGIWHYVTVLSIVNMVAYLCFLELLLVDKMESRAIIIALPFSCVLGFLASMTSTTMVRKQYVWIYATLQFGLVVLFAHIFYSKLRMEAIPSVLLSTFAGFGISVVVNTVVVESLRRPALSQQSETSHHTTPRESIHSPSDTPHHEFVPEEPPAAPALN